MNWRTRVTEMLGIQYPIIEGAMIGVGTVELAARPETPRRPHSNLERP